MNEEELEVLSTEQEQPEQFEQKSVKQSQSVSESLNNVQQGMNDVGKTIENVGKGEEKVADLMSGGEKGAKSVSNVADTAATATDTGAKALKASGKAAEAAGKATEAAGKATEAAGKGTEAAGKVGEGVSKGVQGAGQGMSAAGSSPYTAGLKVAGEAVKTGGKVGEGVSKGVEVAGKAEQAAGKAEQAAGKAEQAAGKAQQATADAANAASKTGKAATGAAKKASDKSFSDKLRERGKINQARGKRIQEQSKKFDSDEIFKKIEDKFGKGGKVLKGLAKVFDPKTIGAIFLLIITLATILIAYILSPMFFMQMVNTTATDPDRVEKVGNYLSGLGFANSKDAFYEEVDYLNIHYGKKLDFEYIMSALYYADIYHGKTSAYLEDNNSNLSFKLAKYYLKEATTTTDENGLVYSANKLYRLRILAKNQFLGEKETTIVTLDEYISKCIEQMDNETKNVVKNLPLVMKYVVAKCVGLDGIVFKAEEMKIINDVIGVFEGTESWGSIKAYLEAGKYSDRQSVLTAIENFLTTFFGSFFNIKSISFKYEFGDDLNPGSLIKVEYYEFSYDQDKFEDYLVDYYIRNMPEFSDLIKDASGNIVDDKVLQVAYEIRLTKDIFKNIYKTDKPAEDNNKCVGNINLDLISQLRPPIDLTIGQSVKFSGTNNFGLYKGTMHNGVDLEDISTGTKQGANVYSIYDGKVLASTVDGTFSDKSAKGGWVMIQYIVQYEDSTAGDSKLGNLFKSQMSTIIVYYGGLNASDLKLKKGDTVKKEQVIGHVGSAAESENGVRPSLHFGVYDTAAGRFLNPVNMFITCKSSETTSITKMCGVKNEQKIWTFLLSKGYTKEAAAGIMGVWKRESGFKPYIVQSKTDSYSKKYTKNVDKGIITRKKFAENGPGGGGYGLAQWTSKDRKYDLYDFANKKGKSVGDLEVQLEFFEKEINSGSYKNLKVKTKLNKATTVEETTKIFLRDYEGGGSSSLELRTKYAKAIYNEYKDYTCK